MSPAVTRVTVLSSLERRRDSYTVLLLDEDNHRNETSLHFGVAKIKQPFLGILGRIETGVYLRILDQSEPRGLGKSGSDDFNHDLFPYYRESFQSL